MLQVEWRGATHARQQQAPRVSRGQAAADAHLRWGSSHLLGTIDIERWPAELSMWSQRTVSMLRGAHAPFGPLFPAGEVRRPAHAALHEWATQTHEEEGAAQAADGAMNSFGSMTL
jgi:hypothetical protein